MATGKTVGVGKNALAKKTPKGNMGRVKSDNIVEEGRVHRGDD